MPATPRTAAVALALSLTTAWGGMAVSASAAPADTSVAATTATADTSPAQAKQRVVKRRVRLGHKAVTVPDNGKLRLEFHGRKGDLVNLAILDWFFEPTCAARTLMHKGKRVPRMAKGFWKLPRKGTYVAVYKAPCDGEAQVRRTRITKVPVDGTEVVVGARANVTHLLNVWVNQPLLVQQRGSNSYAEPVILPDRRSTDPVLFGHGMLLAPGTPPHSSLGDFGALTSTAGRHLLTVGPATVATARPAITHQVTLDGAAATLTTPASPTSATVQKAQHLLTFTGQAGQWIYGETTNPGTSNPFNEDLVIGPDGMPVTTAIDAWCAQKETTCGRDVQAWQLPATGTYHYSRVTSEGSESLRLRTAAVAPDMPASGGPVTYTSPSPGQWVVGAIASPAPGAANPRLRASNASPDLTRFRAAAVSGWVPRCDPYDTSHGCGDYARIAVDQSTLEASDWWIARVNPVIVLQVPPDTKGSVSLSWP